MFRQVYLLLALVLLGCKPAPSTDGQTSSVTGVRGVITFEGHVEPLLVQYCYDCHGDDMDKGGLAFDTYSSQSAMIADKKTWMSVRENLVTHSMPPAKKPQLAPGEFAILKQWIDREVFAMDPGNPDPGRVTIRRLNRVEYNNTTRDLLGVDLKPARNFPQDNEGYGFDNIGDVLTLSPLQLEKYLAAAEHVVEEALGSPAKQVAITTIAARQMDGGQMASDSLRCLPDEGQTWAYHEFKEPGRYRISVKAFGDQAGNEPVKMKVDVYGDGLPDVEFDVRAEKESPELYEMVLMERRPGRWKIGIDFLNDYYVEAKDGQPSQDRNLFVEYIAVEGPLSEEEEDARPVGRDRLYVCEPQSEDDYVSAETILRAFALRAYRRPPTDDEIAKLVGFVRMARAEGDSLDTGIKLALQAALISPQFLFRGELQPQPDNPKEVVLITEYDLATRLSYFIWSSTPDDELLSLAANNTLRKNLRTQVKRLLDDPRSSSLAENFAGQWLRLRALESVMPDRDVFVNWNDELRAAMIRETELFFTSIQREDRSIMDFLSADYTFVNERLAKHYGYTGVEGPYFQRIRLNPERRGGILTHASVLTLTSNPTRTSPVKRGKWVLDTILGTPPPPPPPTVPPIEDIAPDGKKLSFRELLELHAEQPGCSACHLRMDPLGLGLENFDGVGVWRAKDEGVTIDPAGELISGESFLGFAELRDILVHKKSDLFLRCTTKMLMTYALGRGLEITDEHEVERAVKYVEGKDFRFSELVWAVVDSAGFQKRRGDAAPQELESAAAVK